MDNMTTIHLNDKDVELFKKFQQHYDVFSLLEQQGIFDMQYGKATLNFSQGVLQNVTKEQIVFRKLA